MVEAPSPFKALLQKNLDLERAARLAEADSLDDTEWARLIAAAPAQGRALAQTEGYFHAEVTATADPSDAHRIVIKLVPGEPATVGRFTLEFDGELARQAESGDAKAMELQDRLREEWELQRGQVFRNRNWDAAKAQTLSALRNEGYAAASWTATAAQVDPATNRARLFLVVDTGPRFVAGDLVVEGLQRQPERNVRLLAGFGPGTPLTQKRLLDYQDRLQKTGLFDQVAVIYDPDPAHSGHATVTVHVHEQSLQQATVALGVNSVTGPRVTLEHTDRKVFGLPATLSSKLQWGREIQALQTSLATHPAESFHSWITGASVSRILSTGDDVRSGSLRFGRTQTSNALDRTTYAQFERSVQCSTADIKVYKDVDWPDPNHPGRYCVDARALSLNQSNVWRNVDSVVLPTEGYSLSGQIGIGEAGGPPSTLIDPQGNYGPYTRLYARLTQYWPLPQDFHLQARVELGQVIVKEHVAMPDAEQWRAGGEDSVRGYDWRSLAPRDRFNSIVGGNALATASIELAHPVSESLPSVWWATFVDAGGAAARFNDFSAGRGVGVGVRWRSPVGPLKIDLSKGKHIHHLHLDLSVGVVF
ncbi:MAG: BamA/TamA family outer membrane protein [Burkholderiales bacterium]|nr:BamA/TamA family outer membrane protein [Burkholderiales bacterium]